MRLRGVSGVWWERGPTGVGHSPSVVACVLPLPIVVPAKAGTQGLLLGAPRRGASSDPMIALQLSVLASEGQRSGGRCPLFPRSGHPAPIRALGLLPRSSRPPPAGPLPRASRHRASVCGGLLTPPSRATHPVTGNDRLEAPSLARSAGQGWGGVEALPGKPQKRRAKAPHPGPPLRLRRKGGGRALAQCLRVGAGRRCPLAYSLRSDRIDRLAPPHAVIAGTTAGRQPSGR